LIERKLRALASVLLGCSALLIFAIVALIGADVACRGLFDAPLRGVTELVSVGVPAILFLALPHLYVTDKLIRSDLLLRTLQRRSAIAADVLNASFHAIGAGLSASIAMPSATALYSAWETQEFLGVEGDFTVPVWPATLAIVTGSALLGVFCALALYKLARRIARCYAPMSIVFTGIATLMLSGIILFGASHGIDNRTTTGVIAVGLMFGLIYLGAPVAFALGLSAGAGIAMIKDAPVIAVHALALAAHSTVADYIFAAVPLFVLLGLIVGAADIGRDSLLSAQWLLRSLRGGLGVATVAANTVFAAITGISIASAAIFSRVAVPPLIEHGFTPRFSVGLVAGSSVLGMLIPPSLLLIVYGLIAEVSINRLFLAAIVPGLLLAAAFAAGVVCVATWKPRFAITDARARPPVSRIGGCAAASKMLPVAVLIAVVLGGIYGGVFTPTEAGAIGSIAAMLLALSMKRVKLASLAGYLNEAAANSASILFLIVAASAFAIMLTLSGIPSALSATIAAAGLTLSTYTLAYLALLIVLGMVLDSTSILLIMVPLALPTIELLGGDFVWFGIISVIGVEIGLLTPPLGLSVYAIKASLEDESISLGDIFIGSLPFSAIMLCLTVTLIFYPRLAQIY
jgi:tripartite ATP-independent transporter DctM subunit